MPGAFGGLKGGQVSAISYQLSAVSYQLIAALPIECCQVHAGGQPVVADIQIVTDDGNAQADGRRGRRVLEPEGDIHGSGRPPHRVPTRHAWFSHRSAFRLPALDRRR